MSSFDFTSYIQECLGAGESVNLFSDDAAIADTSATKPHFIAQVLTGGLMNHTARITFDKPLREVMQILTINPDFLKKIGDPEMATWKSVVLKHTPPYVAANPSKAMSVDRQLTEKKALEILNNMKDGDTDDGGFRLQELFEEKDGQGETRKKSKAIRIPRLIWHDIDRKILWMEDLGVTRTLSEVLLDPLGSRDSNGHFVDTGEKGNMVAQTQQIAADLGAFLARLYKATTNPPGHLVDYLRSLSNPSGMYEHLTNMMFEILQRPETGVSRADAEVLTDRVRVSLGESEEEGGKDVVLGMVDFWPENVLLELGNGEGDASPRFGLVDWEYFGPSNAASELGMFLAHLHVHMLNSTTSSTANARIQQFAEAMFLAYSQSESGIDWKASNRFKRRALLSHGRELVNAVVVYDTKLDDTAKKRIVNAGVRSLKAAGDSEDGIDLGLLRLSRVEGGEGCEAGEIESIWEGFVALGFDKV